MTPDVSLSDVQKITLALQSHRFALDDVEYLNALDRFGEMFSRLSTAERELVTTLTAELTVVHYSDYAAAMHRILVALDANVANGCGDIIILPLGETKSDGTPKSSSALLYLTEQKCKFVRAFSGKRIRSFERMALVPQKMPMRSSSLFLFVDDFIGTGETAKLTIADFRDTVEATGDKYLVLALVAQERGLVELDLARVPYAVDAVRQRGISDSTVVKDRSGALAVIDAIEFRIGVAAEYRRGFKRSEALVKMIRCPDNTFPLFWYLGLSTRWPAPFPREHQ